MIKPTIGRVVWFFPSVHFMAELGHAYNDPSQPLAAIVSYVWRDDLINLSVHDQNGKQFSVTSVPLIQEGQAPYAGSFHAEWMPYQQGQAKKDAVAAEGQSASGTSHASDVLYPAIKEALDELETLHPHFNDAVNRAYNVLHAAYWSEVSAPADEAAKVRIASASEAERIQGHANTLQGSLDQAYRELTASRGVVAALSDILASVRAIAARQGADTAWERLDHRIASYGIGAVTAKTFRILPSDTDQQ